MTRLLSPKMGLKIAFPCITIVLLLACNSIADRSKSLVNQGSVNQKLSGTWEFKNRDGVKTGTAIFEAENTQNVNAIEGNVYIFSDVSVGDLAAGKTAIAGKFKINASSNPPQIDLTFGDLTTQTIYEIDNSGQLKIANTFANQVRPKTWDAQPQQLTKISDSTAIASDIKILRSPDLIASSDLIREAETKANMRTIMRSQQQVFQTKGQFSTNSNQLATGISLNSQFYKYQITILENGLLAQHSAIPLTNSLKAYTGIVYAIGSNNSNLKTLKLLLCESNIPTQKLPSQPQSNPPDEDAGYQCPNAYTSINP